MRLIKRLFLYLFILFGVAIAAGFWAGKKYGPEIQKIIIQEANKSLKAKVDIKHIDFSFIRNFPNASLVFDGATIYSSLDEQDTLLHAEVLSIQFNLKDLYYKNYNITGLQVKNGFVKLFETSSGTANYQIWESKDSSSSHLQFHLKNVLIQNLAYHQINEKTDLEIQSSIEDINASLSYTKDKIAIELKGDSKNALVLVNNKTVFKQKIFNLNSAFDWKENKIIFAPSSIGLAKMELNLSGSIDYQAETILAIELASNATTFDALLSLFPGTENAFSDYEIAGFSQISSSISGSWTSSSYPSIQANFKISDAYLESSDIYHRLELTQAVGSFSNGKNRNNTSSFIRLKNINAKWGKSSFSGQATLHNFEHPQVSFSGSTFLQLKDLEPIKDSTTTNSFSGEIQGNINLGLKLNDWEKPSLEDWQMASIESELSIKDFFYHDQQSFLSLEAWAGDLNASIQEISFENLSGKYNNQELQMQGAIYNYFSSLFLDKGTLVADLKVQAKKLNINELMPQEEKKDEQKGGIQNKQLFLELETDLLEWNKLAFRNVRSSTLIRDNRVDVNQFNSNAFDGALACQLVYKQSEHQSFNGKIEFENIAINQLFESMDNFDQSLIQAENISGESSGTSFFNFSLNENNELLFKSIELDADLVVENGRLKDVKSLASLSKYVELEELKDIRFSKLQNQINIKDCTIVIPKFSIDNSALSVVLEGKHHFNQNIDYYIELYLKDILKRKVKKPQNEEFGYVEDDGLGRTKIFLRMSGTSSNPVFSYDKTGLKAHLKDKIAKEKESLKKLLNKEFGLFKKDSTINKTKETSAKQKSPFQIEWEESPDSVSTKTKEKPKKKAEKKSKLGKFIDKIAQPNEEEFVDPEDY